MSIAYYNGEFMQPEDIRIPLTDRAIFFGDGVYDAAIGKNGKIYMESEHIERFLKNAAKMDIPLGYNKASLTALLRDCAALSGERTFFIYFQATRFSFERAHACDCQGHSNFLITVTKIAEPSPTKTISLSLFEDKRYSYCDVKTLNLLPSVLACCDAKKRGFDEAIFVKGKTVTECAHSNISIIRNGELITHPESCSILSGTARKKMLDTALDLGIVCREIPFSKEELFAADEILVTSSTKLCVRARQVEEKHFKISSGSLGEEICRIMHLDFQNSMH